MSAFDQFTFPGKGNLARATRELSPSDLPDDSKGATVISVWEARKAGRAFPSRAEMSHRELKEVLPNLFVFEIIYEAGQAVDVLIKLMGTEVVRLYGEQTGKKLSSYPDPAVAGRIANALLNVLETRTVYINQSDNFSEDLPFVSVQVIFLPLSSDQSCIDKVMGLVDIEWTGQHKHRQGP